MLLKTHTKYGDVQGVPGKSEGIVIYKGIPYATPPIGELRWKSPQPPIAWEGTRQCDVFGDPCIQPLRAKGNFYEKEFYRHSFHAYPPKWSEDCLYLNIWTSAHTTEDRLPVMVWIHGGGFTQGYGHEPRYDGDCIARKGVILVSINYRLGILGFFGHPELTQESGTCGNYAIWDQIAALRWVHENIAAFGGDPENVTMFGQSAGAMSVQNVAASPLAKGLVRRAIAQSAAGLTVPANRHKRDFLEERGTRFMKAIGANNLADLRAIPVDRLLELAIQQNVATLSAFPIVADGIVLPMDSGEAIAKGQQMDIDWMIGSTIQESQIFPRFDNDGITKNNFAEKLTGKLGAGYQWVADSCEPEDDEQALALVNKAAGIQWTAAHRALASKLDKVKNHPAYGYIFCRQVPGEDHPGAFHSACIWYAFGSYPNCWRQFPPEDQHLSEIMNQYWTNFAKNGDPNGNGLPQWTPYKADTQLEMKLDVQCGMTDFAHDNPEVIRLQKRLESQEY